VTCLSLEGFIQQTGQNLERIAEESITSREHVATLCEHGCRVEFWGVCRHGCHSIAAQLMLAGHTWTDVCDLF